MIKINRYEIELIVAINEKLEYTYDRFSFMDTPKQEVLQWSKQQAVVVS